MSSSTMPVIFPYQINHQIKINANIQVYITTLSIHYLNTAIHYVNHYTSPHDFSLPPFPHIPSFFFFCIYILYFF